MPVITLPDGSQRSFEQPVTVAGLAASIGAGLAKAALAGPCRRQARRHLARHRSRRHRLHRHRQGRGRARDHPSLHGAPARAGRAGCLPGSAGHHRSRDRGRLLLRLRLQPALHTGGPGEVRSQDARAGQGRPQGRAQAHAARRGRRDIQEARRALQGRDHREHPGERRHQPVRAGRLVRPVPRSARAQHGQARRVQADEGRGRLLARRLEERNAPAHLRHRVGGREVAEGVPHPPRGSREARPSPRRPRPRPVPHAGRGGGQRVLAPEGPHPLAHRRNLHAQPARDSRATSRSRRRSCSTACCGKSRATGKTTGPTCSSPSPRIASSRSSR